MLNYKNIGVEYLAGAVFGLLALIISIIFGLTAGNRISFIVFRSFISVLLFSAIGIGCIFVIKKFVPEIYNVFSMSDNPENVEIKADEISGNTDGESPADNEIKPGTGGGAAAGADSQEVREDKELENEFTSFERQPSEYSAVEGKDSGQDTFSRDVIKDNSIRYEPKIAAQAIRTMMKKDE